MLKIYKNTLHHNNIRNHTVKWIPCGEYGTGVISFFGCNLSCPFCFAQKYSYARSTSPLDTAKRYDISNDRFVQDIVDFLTNNPDICYLQLTGGEPIISIERAEQTIHCLLQLDSHLSKECRIIYQTNGVHLGKIEILPEIFDALKDLKNIKILFEVSIKGTNPDEFNLLSGGKERQFFNYQLKAYWMLKDFCKDSINHNVVARLGIGHHRRSIHFVDNSNKYSLLRFNNWDRKFEEVFDDTTRRFGKDKMIAECINAEGDGGQSNYWHRSIPAIARFIEFNFITERGSESKAVRSACERFHITPPLRFPNLNSLYDDYREFSEYFEPMGKPAHCYCGRNEFNADYRKKCPKNCKFYPRG